MRNDRMLRVLRPSLALVLLAALVVALGLAITGPALSATPSPKAKTSAPATGAAVQRGAEVRAGEDVVVRAGTSVPSVIAFGGDIKVDGAVEDAVVAFGGDVIVNGTVGQSVVAFGGDVTVNGTVDQATVAFGGDVRLTRNAIVGSDLKQTDVSVVVAGGNLTRVPGAQVNGRIERSAANVDWGKVLGWSVDGLLFNPMLGLSFGGWLVQTVFFLVLSLVAAALMPGQLRRVQTQVRRKPWASLGWGALAFFIAVPVIFIAVGITIIGLLLWLPFGLFVLLVYFFGTTALAALLAQRVLGGFGGKENLMLAVVLGVVGTTIVSRIPVVGALALLVMTVMGAGAVILAFVEYRRERREAEAARAAALAAATPAPYPAPSAATSASVITPIVQTSPAQQAPPQPVVPAVPAVPPQPPVTQPAVTQPPVTQPPAAQPPVTQPAPRPDPGQQPGQPAAAPQPPAEPDAPAAPAAPPGTESADAGTAGEQPREEGAQPGQVT